MGARQTVDDIILTVPLEKGSEKTAGEHVIRIVSGLSGDKPKPAKSAKPLRHNNLTRNMKEIRKTTHPPAKTGKKEKMGKA